MIVLDPGNMNESSITQNVQPEKTNQNEVLEKMLEIWKEHKTQHRIKVNGEKNTRLKYTWHVCTVFGQSL